MQIHLVRSQEYEASSYLEVLELLQSFEGPIRFCKAESACSLDPENHSKIEVDEEDFYEQQYFERDLKRSLPDFEFPVFRKELSWEEHFKEAADYRKKYRLSKQEPVFLLTPVANDLNWFCALDPHNQANGFVHTAEWEHYVRCADSFPVAYHVVALILQHRMFSSMSGMQAGLHRQPLGCVNDFCKNKKEVILKLRTADVCLDCMQELREKFSPPELQQLLTILDGVRTRMLFNQNFRQNVKPSRLEVTVGGKFLLPDFANMEIRLTPLEKTLYLFFLNHAEGIFLHDLVDHREELRAIYSRFSRSGLMAEIHNRVEGLVDLRTNSLSEKISKIKASFIKSVGTEIAEHYIIRGESGQLRKVHLPRELVQNNL